MSRPLFVVTDAELRDLIPVDAADMPPDLPLDLPPDLDVQVEQIRWTLRPTWRKLTEQKPDLDLGAAFEDMLSVAVEQSRELQRQLAAARRQNVVLHEEIARLRKELPA